MAVTPAFSQLQNSAEIPQLLSDVKRNGDENWRKMIAEYPKYTYKWRKIWRTADKKGQIKERSQMYELFFPTKCPVKKCRVVNVLLAENGKPLTAEKIEKQRAKAGERLERMETDAQAQEPPLRKDYPLDWMRFAYYFQRPFSDAPKTIVLIDGQEILEKCEFFAPGRETINGREAIGLSFRPRAGAVFGETTRYMSRAEGKIWIDATDRILIRLAIWQKGTKFAETGSDYLLGHAALARDMRRTQEGLWFPGLGRVNGLDYPGFFAEMKVDFSIEHFDHHRFTTEVKTVEIDSLDKKE